MIRSWFNVNLKMLLVTAMSSGPKNDRVQEKFQKFEKNRKNSKFKNPRNTTLGIDVKNMYAKFHEPTMKGSGSKIGGTKMSGERGEEQQREEEAILHAKYANFKQSPNPNQTEF